MNDKGTQNMERRYNKTAKANLAIKKSIGTALNNDNLVSIERIIFILFLLKRILMNAIVKKEEKRFLKNH